MGRGNPILGTRSCLADQTIQVYVRDRFWRASWAGSYEVHYAAGVSVWARWFVAAFCSCTSYSNPPSPSLWPSSPPTPRPSSCWSSSTVSSIFGCGRDDL